MGRPRKDYSYMIGSGDFGDLEVKSVWRDEHGAPWCRVVCVCLKQRDFPVYNLTRTKEPYRSCGCRKQEAYIDHTERQLGALPFHLHVAIWDAAQEDGSTLAKLARSYGIEPAAVRSSVNGIQELVRSFVLETDKDGWFSLTSATRSLMRKRGLECFRFGRDSRLTRSDEKFKSLVVDRAMELRSRWGDFAICHSEPVKSRYELVDWVFELYYETTRSKRIARARATEDAAQGRAWHRTPGPSRETRLWRDTYKDLRFNSKT